jgi:hypothetical protein
MVAPSLSSQDIAIQARAGVWKTHNPNDGSQIGGTMPTAYALIHEVAGRPGAMQLYVEGPAWATMMAYTERPLLFDQFQLDFDIEVLDGNEALMETDIMATFPAPPNTPIPGTSPVQNATSILCNLSLQDLYSEGGQLQDVITQGSWVDIPNAKPGLLAIGKHHYTVTGGWNRAAQTYGFTSVTIDGTTYAVTQNAPGRPSTWAAGIAIQFQITKSPKADAQAAISVVVDNVNLQQFGA